jgi:Zn-dependent peptidase ImmA (M78 family)
LTIRVDVAPEVLRWALRRSGRARQVEQKFPKLPEWLDRRRQPTLRQLEQFATATHTPVGILLLAEPPRPEELPLQDFRTLGDAGVSRPSADLLDTIYLCEERQEWYRDYARRQGFEPLEFVDSMDLQAEPAAAGQTIAELLGFDLARRRQYSTWTDALAGLRERAERLGVLVMISGVVGSNNHRTLEPAEFRGFALVDALAPVVFVNGADTKAAQIFTLAHELAHVWLGQSGVDNPVPSRRTSDEVERWCNRVAAELLVPSASLRREFEPQQPLAAELTRLARLYKVSSLVVLRSLHDARLLRWEEFRRAYDEEMLRLADAQRGAGGDFYKTTPVRLSRRFTQAVVGDTLEGGTSYGSAFRLLGFKKQATFDELSRQIGAG